MSRWARIWFCSMMVMLILVTSGIWQQYAEALTCAPPSSVEKEFERSDSVFRGEAIKREKTTAGSIITFRVITWWKGAANERVEIYESDMWLTFEIGEQYLIYAKPDPDGRPRANLCGRSHLWEKAGSDAAVFGPPIADFPIPSSSARAVWLYGAVVVAVVAAAVIAIIVNRKGKQK